MDILEVVGVAVIFTLFGAALFFLHKAGEGSAAIESRRERRWARELEKDEEKVLSQMSTPAQLLYKGIEACEDGKLSHTLYYAYSGWEDHATEMERYVLKHAYKEAKKREKMHEIMVNSAKGWDDNEIWTTHTLTTTNPGFTSQLVRQQQLLQKAKDLGVYTNVVGTK